jgi:hypothetical protein
MAKRKGKGSQGKTQPPIREPAAVDAWDRTPDESDPAFRAFREYLLLGGERSTRTVAQRLDKSHTLIGRWSSRHRWVARAQAFDAEAAKRSDEATLDVLAERARRQAEISESALEALAAPSLELLRRLGQKTGREELEKLPMDQLVPLAATTSRAIPRVVQTERLARGQSTTNVGGHRGGPLETDDKGRTAAERAAAEERAANMPTDTLTSFLLGADTARAVDAAKAKPKAKSKAKAKAKKPS